MQRSKDALLPTFKHVIIVVVQRNIDRLAPKKHCLLHSNDAFISLLQLKIANFLLVKRLSKSSLMESIWQGIDGCIAMTD